MSLVVNLLRRSAMRNALALCAIFMLVLALCGIWMIAQFRADVRSEIDTQLLQAYQELSASTEAEFRSWFQDQDDYHLFTESYRAADGTVWGAVRSEVFDHEGLSTMTTHELFQPRFFTECDEITEDLGPLGLDGSMFKDETWRIFVGPIHGGQIAVIAPVSGIEDALELIPQVMLTVGGALVLTTLFAGALIARRQQTRLDRVRDGIARIGRGNLRQPIAPPNVRDDLDEIMVGIDSAAADLDRSISRLRLFSQNVAHELRTPLARLRATLEDSPEVPEAALERTDEVIRTLDAVQRIARLSHQPDPGTLLPVALDDVVGLAQELFDDVAAENGQRLQIKLSNPATVQGDFQLLLQMLSNLVENAIRHAGSGAGIFITVDGARMIVRDTGPGLTGDQDLTEPFARAPEARGREGSGLGLALVKTIATYHGATLDLTSDGGLEAIVDFSEPNARLDKPRD